MRKEFTSGVERGKTYGAGVERMENGASVVNVQAGGEREVLATKLIARDWLVAHGCSRPFADDLTDWPGESKR